MRMLTQPTLQRPASILVLCAQDEGLVGHRGQRQPAASTLGHGSQQNVACCSALGAVSVWKHATRLRCSWQKHLRHSRHMRLLRYPLASCVAASLPADPSWRRRRPELTPQGLLEGHPDDCSSGSKAAVCSPLHGQGQNPRSNLVDLDSTSFFTETSLCPLPLSWDAYVSRVC